MQIIIYDTLTENYIDFCICVNKPIISDAGGSSLIDARWGHLHTIWIGEPLLGDTKSSSVLPIIAISSFYKRNFRQFGKVAKKSHIFMVEVKVLRLNTALLP